MVSDCEGISQLMSELVPCRTSLAFRLMPQGNAILDCSPIAAAGHVIPQSYVPISVTQFMDDLSVEEDVLCNQTDIACVSSIFLLSILRHPREGKCRMFEQSMLNFAM